MVDDDGDDDAVVMDGGGTDKGTELSHVQFGTFQVVVVVVVVRFRS